MLLSLGFLFVIILKKSNLFFVSRYTTQDDRERIAFFSKLKQPSINDYVMYQANEESALIGKIHNIEASDQSVYYKVKLSNNPQLEPTIKQKDLIATSVIGDLPYHQSIFLFMFVIVNILYIASEQWGRKADDNDSE